MSDDRRRKDAALQIVIGIVTSVTAGVIAALIIDGIKERKASAPLPQPVAPGWQSV